MIIYPIYLDNHSTTKLDPLVLEEMLPYFTEKYGNAASKTHSFGWEAEAAVEGARKRLALLINAEPDEIIFTSGATESINITHFGVAESLRHKGNHIITTKIEHSAVLGSLEYLSKAGFEISVLDVDENGRFDFAKLEDQLTDKTILVSIQTANNEIGTINDISRIGNICKEKGILFHTDTAQAIGKVQIDVKKQNIDLLSLSGHKFNGPKGTGILYKKKNLRLSPSIFGGGQEQGIRPGTLNVPLIVGLGKAASLVDVKQYESVKNLRDLLYNLLKSKIEVELNGSFENRLPNNLNIKIDGVNAATLLGSVKNYLALSLGSACSSGDYKGSRILKEIGLDESSALSSLRIGLSKFTTEEEIIKASEILIEAILNLKNKHLIIRD